MNLDQPHRRFNPLTGQWVLVSPHRASRPWQGQVEKLPVNQLPEYDPTCYLCPGNVRDNGTGNPVYTGTYVFDNDFASLLRPDGKPETSGSGDVLFYAEPEYGINRVVCFSPRHDLTIPELPQSAVECVISTWVEETTMLANVDYIQYVQVFENKGAMMGCSNPHPHSQIWASSHIPNEPALEIKQLGTYRKQHGTCLLCDVLKAEQHNDERVVAFNDHFMAIIPFWAVWPFEVMVLARRHVGSLPELNPAEISALADIYRLVTIRYDNLFETSFPYSMGFHQTPCDGSDYPDCHLHMHFFPPLLRSATVRKFMVGFELLAMPQRDLTPETAAERLRQLSDVHYKNRL